MVWSEKTEDGVVLHMRVGTGADVMLTLPNAEVAAQAEAQLRSTLAMATMRFQRVGKETTSGGKSWEGFMPEETKAHIAAQAEDIVRATSDGRFNRALLAEVASFAASVPFEGGRGRTEGSANRLGHEPLAAPGGGGR
jgi:hypothetical protein